MGIFSRMTDIIQANLNAMLDKAEDPEKIVRLMVQEMEDTLVEARTAAARAIADKKELSRKHGNLTAEADEWQSKAELAIKKDREDLAKAALTEKNELLFSADVIKEQVKDVESGLEKLNQDITRLEEKLADARNRQKTLIMRQNTAVKQLEVRRQIYDNKFDDALMRFEKFERKMDYVEGRVESYDLGRARDLRDEFADLENDEDIQSQLAELKQKVQNTAS
ncbi:MAG: phage shock protein PspA [Gammaproteobacteria bacterium]|nr:phage shock protein PspA [Gammaproteobacteria bacterium]NNM14296.1 phage shock protein PspA [Gammaproteobacteria bacterium]